MDENTPQPYQPHQPDHHDHSNAPDAQQKKMQTEIEKYKRAYQQEFEIATNTPAEQALDVTKEFFKKAMPSAAAQIVWLSEYSSSDSVRLNASKYIIEVGREDVERDGDPVRDLLMNLKKNVDSPVPQED